MAPLPARTKRKALGVLLIPILLVGISLVPAGWGRASDQVSPALQTTPLPIDRVPMSDEACLECHSNPNMVLPLPSGEKVSLTVESVLYKTSVHGREGYACVQCHTDITGFPHPEQDFQDTRDLTIYMSRSCRECHPQATDAYDQGAHAANQASGKKEAAVCADCHGSHSIREFSNLRTRIAAACQQCHAEIYNTYKNSVHGKGLLEDFNPDVPTCIDCHDYHRNAGPTNEGFHLFSPQICAKCHDNEDLMAKYDINTRVFDTFVADFHGTTVTIFERVAPDQETNKPVCIDCHGVHNIKPPDDVTSTVFKQNLLATCQRCHPDATPNFPDAWLRHYDPDPTHNTLVYLVNLFYKIFIPGTLSIMAIFVVTDFWHNKIRRKKRAGSHPERNGARPEDESEQRAATPEEAASGAENHPGEELP